MGGAVALSLYLPASAAAQAAASVCASEATEHGDFYFIFRVYCFVLFFYAFEAVEISKKKKKRPSLLGHQEGLRF